MTTTVIAVSALSSASVAPAVAETHDTGAICLGGAFRLPPVPVPSELADPGRIRLGGAFRLPAAA